MNTEIANKLPEITNLISMPEVYIKVNELMSDPSSDIYSFAEVVVVDPNLSSLVLKLVNSAYFGYPEPIQNIAQAISLIGLDQFYNIVLGVSAISSLTLPNEANANAAFSLGNFWWASLHAGVLAQLLAKRTEVQRSEEMFVAGLLHEVGHLILHGYFPALANATMNKAETESMLIQQAEVELLGCHYGDIGSLLMANWKLSERLVSLTRNQPFPQQASEARHECTLLNVAHIYGQLKSEERAAGQPTNMRVELSEEKLIEIGILQEELELDLATADVVSADMANVIFS